MCVLCMLCTGEVLKPFLDEIREGADWAGIIDVRLAMRARSGDSGLSVAHIPTSEPRQASYPLLHY